MAGNDSTTSSNQVIPCHIMDIVKSIATPVLGHLTEPLMHEAKCLFCASKVINGLENQKKELTLKKDSMQSRVEQAKNRNEVIGKPVEDWLEDAENLLNEVQDLETKMKAEGKGWWTRYCLCRQMAEKTKAMTDFIGRSSTEPVFLPAPLPGIQYHSSSDNFTYFESTKVAHDELWKALQDDSIYMIGLYGMGGCGKTTLVEEVGKKAERLNLFDRAISVTVSQTPNIRGMQGKVADMIRLKLEEESEEGRAQEIWLRLQGEKRVLVIVDDLWGQFNLEDIGICLNDNYKGRWKILLTTRRQEVCDSMNCQTRIQLGLLSEDEAWTLFQKYANIDEAFSSKSLNNVPRLLCMECQGLPLTIEALGSSLKGKPCVEWEAALNNLRHSDLNDDHMDKRMRAAFNCLKLSYDYLESKEAKLLFLMCSIFPEDYEIFIEDLIRYAVGLGLGSRVSLDFARTQIIASINKLVDSCLLMHYGESKHHLKMHDMVRDVTLWIASKSEDHRKILVNHDKPLSALEDDDRIKDYFAISSWYKEKGQISLQLNAPNLEILLLNAENWGSLDISNASFEGIQGLKVMTVINEYYSDTSLSLPQSPVLLTCLRTLRLNGLYLGDMSFLISLTKLEILDFQGCSFRDFPTEIVKLKALKLLDLSNCHIQKNYNYEAIGKCLKLEELYAFGHGNPDYHSQSLADVIALPKLQRFVIAIEWFKPHYYSKSMKVLNLLKFNISSLSPSKQNLLQKAEHVFLEQLNESGKNIIPEMVGVVGRMNCLTNLGLCDCSEIKCLIDTTSDHVGSLQVDALIPRLVKLELSEMKNLKELCRGPPLQVLGFFEKLEELYIRGCMQLHNIFPGECNLCNLKILCIGNYGSVSYNWEVYNCTAAEVLFPLPVARSLVQLEELTIEGCKELKHIIASGAEDGSNTTREIVPASRNSDLVMPNLKKLSVGFCTKLEYIFPISFVEGLTQLQEMKIFRASKLTYVFGGYEDRSSLHKDNQMKLPCLEVFKLIGLENMLGMCPINYHLRYPSLTVLSIMNCPKFPACSIVGMDGFELGQQHLNKRVATNEGQQIHLTTNFKQLKLHGLPELIFIWSSPTPLLKLNLQYLQHVQVYGCQKLKSIFPMFILKSLSELTSLKIYDCEELEEIISGNPSGSELCLPKLRVLKIKKCNKLKSLFSIAMVRMLPQLSILLISKASQLEEVFRHGDEDGSVVNQTEIVLPNLTKITLYKLPSFVDISQRFKLLAVKLQQLHIHKCPKTTAILREIQVSPLPSQPEMMREETEDEEEEEEEKFSKPEYIYSVDSEPSDEDDCTWNYNIKMNMVFRRRGYGIGMY